MTTFILDLDEDHPPLTERQEQEIAQLQMSDDGPCCGVLSNFLYGCSRDAKHSGCHVATGTKDDSGAYRIFAVWDEEQ